MLAGVDAAVEDHRGGARSFDDGWEQVEGGGGAVGLPAAVGRAVDAVGSCVDRASDVLRTGPALKTLTGPAIDAAVANTPGWREADLGAVNGHGNAVSVAQILSAVTLGGTAHDVRLLSPETIDLIFEEQANGVDLVLGIPLRWGVGFALPQLQTLPYIPDERVCFWGGWGSSMSIMDIGRGLTISYMMNRMSAGIIGSENAAEYCDAIYDALRAHPAAGRAQPTHR